MIETSESISELSKALVKAQSAMKGAARDSVNPGFKTNSSPGTRYASLEKVIEAAKPALQGAGIAFVQAPGAFSETGTLEVTTMLIHGDSAQWMRSTLHMLVGKRDPQGIGSAVTYACRYSLMALLGLPPVDDDGEGAIDRNPRKTLSSQHAKEIIKTDVIQKMIDGATTTKAADAAAAHIAEYAAFMPAAWIKAFFDRLDHQRDLIAKGGVVDEPPNAMDQAYAETMREDYEKAQGVSALALGVDTRSQLKRSLAMEQAATALEKAKSPEDLGAIWDAEVDQQFDGEARARLQAVYVGKLKTMGVGADA